MDMYNLLIVDDEEDIREGLNDIVEWDKIGFSVVAQFDDGKEALRYIEDNDVDAVLTDVKMTSVSGIELAKALYDSGKKIKVVILSGYSKFEYAQAAMQYNVSAYLTKPTNLIELEDTFKRIKQQLDDEAVEKDKQNVLQMKLDETLRYARDDFFIKLLSGQFAEKSDDILKNISVINLDINTEQLCAIYAIECDQKIVASVQERYFNSSVLDLNFFLTEINNVYKVLVFVKKQGSCESIIEQSTFYIESACKKIKTLIDVHIEAYLEDVFSDIYEMANIMGGIEDVSEEDVKYAYMGSNQSILKTLKYIKDNFNSDISLETAAVNVCITPIYLSRLFKKEMGCTFTDFLRYIRIKKAKELLKERKMSIGDVCEMVGYKSEKYFIKIFSKCTGMTISQYRKSCED